jgi:hypothetical protein
LSVNYRNISLNGICCFSNTVAFIRAFLLHNATIITAARHCKHAAM